jgi:hypothetical protein
VRPYPRRANLVRPDLVQPDLVQPDLVRRPDLVRLTSSAPPFVNAVALMRATLITNHRPHCAAEVRVPPRSFESR